MTLGENIARLRTERGMSQGELAEALQVSRQSVSKWETDGSVPELEKLIRMSALFSVTLDAVVKGPEEGGASAPAEEETDGGAEKPRPAAESFSWQKCTGVLLLCFSLLTFLLAGLLESVLSGLILASPLLLCGLICLLVRRHAGLCCGWALCALLWAGLRPLMGLTPGGAFHTVLYGQGAAFQRAVAWAMLLLPAALAAATARAFRRRGK